MIRVLIVILLLLSFGFPGFCAEEKKWPAQPIELYINYAVGSTSDVMARLYAPILSKELGTPVVVMNKPAVAAEYVAAAKPDGYTILENSFLTQAWHPHLRHTKYTLKDFTYIISHSDYNFAFLIRNDAPWKTFKEWVDYSRKKPGVKFGSPGIYSIPGIAMDEIIRQEKLKVLHVPFKGGAEVNTGLLGGHLDIGGGSGGGFPLIRAGKLRTLLQLSGEAPDPGKVEKLAEVYPDFPPGLRIGIEMPRGLVGPKGIPAPVVEKIGKAMEKTARSEEFKKYMEEWKCRIVIWNGNEVYKNVQTASEAMSRLLKETGFVKK